MCIPEKTVLACGWLQPAWSAIFPELTAIKGFCDFSLYLTLKIAAFYPEKRGVAHLLAFSYFSLLLWHT